MNNLTFNELSRKAQITAITQTQAFMTLAGYGKAKDMNHARESVLDYLTTSKEGSYCRYNDEGKLTQVHFSKRTLFQNSFNHVLAENEFIQHR